MSHSDLFEIWYLVLGFLFVLIIGSIIPGIKEFMTTMIRQY